MNIKRAKEEIKNSIEAYLAKDARGEYLIPAVRQRPLLLMGPPGIGKTQIMEQVARECRVGLVSYTITHHTRQSAIGLPFITEKEFGGKMYSVTEYTMSEIVASVYEKIEKTGLSEGILFIDEINCASETLAPTMLQFLQAKTFGSHKIPGGWIIVAAGNPPEYNKSVREFDMATLDRVKWIPVEADFSVWKEYAYQTGIHPAVISYLSVRREYFYSLETTVEGKWFATPRGWEDLSRLMDVYEAQGKAVDRDVVAQYIRQPKIAKDFANYLDLYHKYRSDDRIGKVLEGGRDEALMAQAGKGAFDEKLSVIGLILSRQGNEYKSLYLREQYMEILMNALKSFRTSGEAGAVRRMEEIYAREQAELDRLRSAELLTREEEYVRRDVLESVERYLKLVRDESLDEPEQAFTRMQEEFARENEAFGQAYERAGAMTERAFDFMEGAFGAGQELVLFVTELNLNFYSLKFLQEYECERYYQYNQSLLFEDREEQIRRRLEEI